MMGNLERSVEGAFGNSSRNLQVQMLEDGSARGFTTTEGIEFFISIKGELLVQKGGRLTRASQEGLSLEALIIQQLLRTEAAEFILGDLSYRINRHGQIQVCMGEWEPLSRYRELQTEDLSTLRVLVNQVFPKGGKNLRDLPAEH